MVGARLAPIGANVSQTAPPRATAVECRFIEHVVAPTILRSGLRSPCIVGARVYPPSLPPSWKVVNTQLPGTLLLF